VVLDLYQKRHFGEREDDIVLEKLTF